uniref:glycosyltransferase family 4 protein n=1 Tax=Alistipes shahii TaxID=328814 RepID=UPI003FED6958
MKVIVPFSYYYPEQCAGLNIIDDVLRACAQEKIKSLLYVPTPTRNVPKGAKWEKDEVQEGGLMHIHRFWMYGEGKNPILRALRYMFTEVAYLHALLWKDYDVIFLDSTPPIQGLKLPLVKLFRKKPVVHNAQDIFPDSLAGAGLAKKGGLLWKIGCWVSNITYKYSDKIIVISEDFKQTLMNKGVPEEKIVVVYNWVNEKLVVAVSKRENPFYSEFNLDRKKFRVVYAGNLGNAQNIDVIINSAARLKDHEQIEFVLFGSGGLESDIKKRIADEGLANMKMFPLQPVHKVSYVYSLGDLCIVSCKAGFGGSAMPSKTWSILSSARPVLANFDDGELKRTLEENGFGIFTKADDVDAMVAAIVEASKHPERCDEMGRKGRAYIEEYLTKDKNTKKYVDVIKSVCK